ncbi:ComF family protein [Pyruvatibacter sp.]|uniref:ComF family protein n=1 Tax=Pyruvatibacter sp. TaxID=1981328 RepID=UPI0032EFE586
MARLGRSIFSAGRVMGRGLIAVALPPVCPLTGERVSVPGTLAPAAWSQLTFITAPLCDVSGVPFETDLGVGAISAAAAARPPVYDRARAALLYDGMARRLVHQLKYSDRMDLAPLLARLMAVAGRDLLAGADMIVPVPLHRRRMFARRFNQAALLARVLGEVTGVTSEPDLLERVRPTQSQVGLSRAGRRRNVRGAFRLRQNAPDVAGRHIVVIDDVLTSGATVEACAVVLKRAGAARVDVLTAARVVAALDATI